MYRKSYYALTGSAQNLDFALMAGNAVLVMLKGNDTPDVTIDFEISIDGTNYFAAPYAADSFVDATPTRATTQITNPTTAILYLVLPPIAQFRVKLGAITSGTLDVVLKEVLLGGFVI